MREYHYRVDRDGRIFHDGTEIVDPRTLRFFVRAMERRPDGRHLVLCQGERNWFEADDTPLVVQRLRLAVDGGRLVAAELALAGDHHEPLDPTRLETERGHLYGWIRAGRLRVRFGRVAMQQLAPYLSEDGGGPALCLGADRHPIAATAGASA